MKVTGVSLKGHENSYLSSDKLNRRLQHHDGDVATCASFYATWSHRSQSWRAYPVT